MDSQDLKLVFDMINLLSEDTSSNEQVIELEQLLGQLTSTEGVDMSHSQERPDSQVKNQFTQEEFSPNPDDPFLSSGATNESNFRNDETSNTIQEQVNENLNDGSNNTETSIPDEFRAPSNPVSQVSNEVDQQKLKELETEVHLLRDEVKEQKELISVLEVKKSQYKEEAESHLMTSQMTIKHLMGELKNAASEEEFQKEYTDLIGGVTSKWFNVNNLITTKFPDSLIYNRRKGIGDNNILFVKEQYGLLFLVVVHHPFKNIQSAVLSLFSKQLLESLVVERRGIRADELLQKFEESFRKVVLEDFVTDQSLEGPYKMTCCILDERRMEIEYSSNGLPIFLNEENVLQEYTPSVEDGKYSMQQLPIRKDETLFIPCYKDIPSGFEKYLQEISKLSNNQQQDEKLSAFLESDSNFIEDFLLVGIKM